MNSVIYFVTLLGVYLFIYFKAKVTVLVSPFKYLFTSSFTYREVPQFFWLSDFGGERQHASPESDLSLCRSPQLILVGTETRRLVFISFAFPSLELFPLLCDYISGSYSSHSSPKKYYTKPLGITIGIFMKKNLLIQ